MKTMISVIMSVYREPIQDVVISVESILSQTYQKWEMIIVLDCPKNLEVKKYLTSLSTSFENIHFIENKINLGLGASLNKAISIAKEQGLDLIEIAPNAKPPVCKIIDMGKFKYDAQKKANVAKKKQKIVALKEIKMRPVTETHDYNFK